MKETKVYVEELPKECWDCPCFKTDLECSCGLSDGTQDYFKDEIDGENCPLKLLKIHDRELVKEVCEKIKEKAFGLWYFVLNEQKEHFEGNRYVLSQKDFNDILDQIQKEYEK